MDERHEELAALNALSMLESDEKRVLDGSLLADKELRDLTAELEGVAGQLIHAVTPVEPPANMKRRIREKIRARGGKSRAPSAAAIFTTLGWGLAAALAVASLWLWNDRAKLTNELAAASKLLAPLATSSDTNRQVARSLEDELKNLHADFDKKQSTLKTEIESLRQREDAAKAQVTQLTATVDELKKQDAASQLQIASLQSTVWEYRKSAMVVAWDTKRQQGVVMLDKMPRLEAGQDYQLWVIDPKKPAPVSGGVVVVDAKGGVKIPFKATEDVGEGLKFALSVEKKGGVPRAEGPIVFVGQ